MLAPAISCARQTRPTALLTLQGAFFDRFCLAFLLVVVILPLALALMLGCTEITEPMSGWKFPATGTTILCRRLGLRGLGRSAKTKPIEQIEAVLFILMPSPVIFAYLTAYPFRQWPPAQKRQAPASFNIAYSVHIRHLLFLRFMSLNQCLDCGFDMLREGRPSLDQLQEVRLNFAFRKQARNKIWIFRLVARFACWRKCFVLSGL